MALTLPPAVLSAALTELGGFEVNAAFVWMNYSGTVWRLVGAGGSLFLKRNEHLTDERDRLVWLHGRLPVPELVGLYSAQGDDWLLTRAISGVPLSDKSIDWEPRDVARFLGETLRRIHDTDASGCPFGDGSVLIHGDFCLPNVLVESGRLAGIVDVGRSGLGDPHVDLGAAIWTLQYNFKVGYARDFLDAYEAEPMSDQEIERLRRTYAD